MDQVARLNIWLVGLLSIKNLVLLGGHWGVASNLGLEMALIGLASYKHQVGKVVRQSVKQWATRLNPLLPVVRLPAKVISPS
jgi:hypothetical protein